MASTGGNLLGCMLPCVCSVIAHRVTRYHKAVTFTLSWLSYYVHRAKLLGQSWSVLLTFEPVNEILQFDQLNETSSAVLSHDSVLQNKIWSYRYFLFTAVLQEGKSSFSLRLILLIIFILQANPKTRGYLWFCTECDESVSDWELWITRGGIFHTIPVGGGRGRVPQRVWFLRRFGLKRGIDFAWSGLNSGMVFEGIHERICRFSLGRFNSKWIRKNWKERVICEFEVDFKKSFSWRSNLSTVNSRLADTPLWLTLQ